ncbi:sarcosine oxidase subunit delta [Acinetobacter baylyi]|nr:sarcosine oxidase subunit delta [Acinetobacter baylyi]
MKIMHCPLNGPRNISEFTYGGEFKDMPDQNTCSDLEWADYVFNTDNIAGVVLEWWMHTPSSYWFIAQRHTVTDEIIRNL